MECVNCKTRYLYPKYNLNGTCYDEIPEITYEDPDVKGKNMMLLMLTAIYLQVVKKDALIAPFGIQKNVPNISLNFIKKITIL